MEVFPTPGSPKNTSLYLVSKFAFYSTYFSSGVIRGAPPSVVDMESAAALILIKRNSPVINNTLTPSMRIPPKCAYFRDSFHENKQIQAETNIITTN